MTFLIVAAVLGVIFVLLQRHDPRMLRNGLVLMAAAGCAVTGIADVASQWFPWTRWVTLSLLAMTPLAVLVLAAFLIANGAAMLRREGRSLANILSLLAGLALLGLPAAALLLIGTLHPVALGLAALLLLLCSYFGGVFVVFLVYALAYERMKHSAHPAAVVVLGAQIIDGQVPPLLRSRLDKALELYRQSPAHAAPLLIPSGGQGTNESRSEGAAMAQYLLDAGAAARDIVAEERAVNTAQNLEFSAALAREQGRDSPLLVVTNNYHALRTALLARKLGIAAEVVGSPTASYFLPSAFLREFAAVLREHKKLHAFMCLPFVALTAALMVAIIHVP